MKKLTLLALALPFAALPACNGDNGGDTGQDSDTDTGTDTDSGTVTATDTSATMTTSATDSTSAGTDSTTTGETDTQTTTATTTETDTGAPDCADPDDPNVTKTPIDADINMDRTLTCDQVWVLTTLITVNGATLTGARVPFAMARDGMFIARAAVLSPRTHVPVAAVLLQAGWACVLAASGTYDQLTDYVIFASWIFYGLVTSAVFVLRVRAPELARPYRTLGYPIVPLVFVLVAVWLVINTLLNRPVESVLGLALISLGLPVYWYYRGSAGAKDPVLQERVG